MTMLDRMRRHKNWLKWSLGLVVLAFVIFYIPDFLTNPATDLAASDNVAVVGDYEIKGLEFQRTYQAQVQAYQTATGGKMNDRLMKSLGIDQQILQQLVDEYAAFVEAERLNIQVSDEEVRQRILTFPAFQDNGTFIGEQRYQQLLAMQNPPLSAAEFERGVRRALTVEKLRVAVAGWVTVTDAEAEQEYRRINDKVKLAVVSFPVDNFRSQVTASEAELASHFESNKETFRVPEKRKIRFVLVDTEALRAKMTVPESDIERRYNDSFSEFTTADELRASHILFTTEGKDEATVRTAAEEVLKQARSGADFAELARKFSQDQTTAGKGGDLDYFERGRMVPEFDAVAFTLEPNQISDLVQTQYGFHIIKVTEKRSGATRTLQEVRPQLVEELTAERVQTEAAAVAERLARQVTRPEDLDAVAKAEGLTVEETGFFARDEPILGLGASPELALRVFQMTAGQVSNVLQTSRGYVMVTLVAQTDPYLPQLNDVKDRVQDEVIRQKAGELARQRAAELAPKLKSAPDFERTAKASGVEVQVSELITRESPVPSLGLARPVTDAAFALPQGGVSDPIATDTGTAIVKVMEKQEVSATDLAANRERFRGNLLADRQSRFFDAYMAKAKQRMTIQVNPEVVQRITG